MPDEQMVIAQDIPALLKGIEGHRLYPHAILALFGGLRLREVLAVRDNTLDLDGKMVEVKEALEQTTAHGIRFKAPKSKAGRRKVSLPDIAVDALREYRKSLMEQRMQLGLGKLPADALLFSDLEGKPLSPGNMSSDWGDLADAIDTPDLTFHGLRHTHVSQLIDAGVDIVTISKRIGHANPATTLRIYAHLFRKDDSKAAAAINAAFGAS